MHSGVSPTSSAALLRRLSRFQLPLTEPFNIGSYPEDSLKADCGDLFMRSYISGEVL